MLYAVAKGVIAGRIIGLIAAAAIAAFGGHYALGHHGHSLVRTPNCVVMSDGNDRIVQCGRGNTVITSGNDSTSGVGEGNTGGGAYVGD